MWSVSRQDLEASPANVALGRFEGKKGGKARAAQLTPEQRRQIARKATRARGGTNPPA